MRIARHATAFTAACAVLSAQGARAIELDQVDDFAGSVQFWQRGVLSIPGPGGPADEFLRISADGTSQNGLLVTFNQAQWAGDYLAEEVVAVAALLNNTSDEPLHVRLAFGDNNAPRLGGTWYASIAAVDLPPMSGWTQAVFPIGSTDLVQVQGAASYESVMSNVVTLRILHEFGPAAQGDSLIGVLGIDEITALPEPGAIAAPSAGVAALAVLARRRRAAVTLLD